MSSSRDSASSNSTNTWRLSRSSVSSDMSRANSAYGGAKVKKSKDKTKVVVLKI